MDVWIIDDNPLHSALVKNICKSLGIKCKCYLSFEELTKELVKFEDQACPKVVFIDLVLEEGRRGEELLQILKDIFKDKEVKFIAFTADLVSKKELFSLGFHDVIYKPITREKLVNVIRDLFDEFQRAK